MVMKDVIKLTEEDYLALVLKHGDPVSLSFDSVSMHTNMAGKRFYHVSLNPSVNLWGKIHGIDPETVRCLLFDGITASQLFKGCAGLYKHKLLVFIMGNGTEALSVFSVKNTKKLLKIMETIKNTPI